jgi:hypothetical protein
MPLCLSSDEFSVVILLPCDRQPSSTGFAEDRVQVQADGKFNDLASSTTSRYVCNVLWTCAANNYCPDRGMQVWVLLV